MNKLTQERLKELFRYEEDTGFFIRLKNGDKSKTKKGDIVKSIDKGGYVRVSIDYKRYLVHRLAWFYVHGVWPDHQIDHINGNRTDNRIANLRLATFTLNRQNLRKAMPYNSTVLLGASKFKGKFQALIWINGKRKYLGVFNTPENAHYAYLEAKRKYHAGCTI